MPLAWRTSRRRFLGLGAAFAAAAAGLGATCVPPPPSPPVPRVGRAGGQRHLAWVWQFSNDSPPERIVSVLARHGLGVMLKTHDGTHWMRRYDTSPFAAFSPEQVRVLADYFESYGVPFHAWCVLKGLNPAKEAEICAQVIGAGARSITVDVEPHSGFWQGTVEDARTFGREFRRRQPNATLYVSIDPRPWVLEGIPLDQFAGIAQGFAPQIYWETFDTSGNWRRFESSGYPPDNQGVTPRFLLSVTHDLLRKYGLPILPAGQGASRDMAAWREFMDQASALGMKTLSVWRYGVTDIEVWRLLSGLGPLPPLAPGVQAVVSNTLDCLNIRERPTVGSAVIQCVPDGTVVRVLNPSVDADGYRWWPIEAGAVRGWSAEAEPGGVRWLVPMR